VDLDSSLAGDASLSSMIMKCELQTRLKNHNALMCSRHIPCAKENVMREECFALVSETARVDVSKFLKLSKKTGTDL
jgi:hypothetical protein